MSENNKAKNKKSNTVITSIAVICFVVCAVLFVLIKTGNLFGDKAKPAPEVVYENEVQAFVENKGYEIECFYSVSALYVPQAFNDVYEKYNELQKSQGYDLEPYKGVKYQEYVYELKDFKISGRKAYMTVMVKDGNVIGGHISSLSGDGKFYNLAGELYE